MAQDEGVAPAAVPRWRQVYGCIAFCLAFVPASVLTIEWTAHVRLDSTQKFMQDAAFAALFASLLLPSVPGIWRFYRLNWNRMLRYWGVRMLLAGVGGLLAGMLGIFVAQAVSGQRQGLTQTLFLIVTLAGGGGLIILGCLVGMLEASRAAIERYRSDHPAR